MWRERLVHQRPEPGVVGRVEREHGELFPRRQHGLLAAREPALARVAGEVAVVAQDRVGVGVAGEQPGVHQPAAVHRVALAQGGVDGIRVLGHAGGERVVRHAGPPALPRGRRVGRTRTVHGLAHRSHDIRAAGSASERTRSTNWASRVMPCFSKIRRMCQRTVFSLRPIATAMLRTDLPSARSTATRLCTGERSSVAATSAGSTGSRASGSTTRTSAAAGEGVNIVLAGAERDDVQHERKLSGRAPHRKGAACTGGRQQGPPKQQLEPVIIGRAVGVQQAILIEKPSLPPEHVDGTVVGGHDPLLPVKLDDPGGIVVEQGVERRVQAVGLG